MALSTVLFDVDGTLVDSVDLHAEAWQRALRHFGHEVPFAKIRSQIGKGGDQLLPMFLPRRELEKLGPKMEAFRGQLYKAEMLPRVRPFPRVRELFEGLRSRGCRIVLASSAKEDELRHIEELLRVGDLIEATTSKDDAGRSKPHPDIFAAAMARAPAARKDEVLVIGDSPWDAEAARRLGVLAVGVLCGGFSAEDLRAAGCVALYRDPADLLEHLDDPQFGRR